MSDAPPTDLPSAITHVMVFRSGAVITRIAALAAPLTDGVLSLCGLPPVLDDGSVRVRLESGTGSILPTDVRVELVLPPAGESIVDSDSEKLLEAVRVVDGLRSERDRVAQELALFSQLHPTLAYPEGRERPPPAATTAWRETLAWQRQESERRHAEVQELERRIKLADEERARLERAIRAARAESDNRAARVSKRVLFSAHGVIAAGTRVTLEYRVPGARWAPTYVVRVARDGKSAEVALRAMIAQSTGEYWPRVKLSLSTAQLLRAQDVPELKSLRIGRQLPFTAKAAWRAPPADTDRLFHALDAAVGRDPVAPATTGQALQPLYSQAVAPPVVQPAPPPAAPPPPPAMQAMMFGGAPGGGGIPEATMTRAGSVRPPGAAMPPQSPPRPPMPAPSVGAAPMARPAPAPKGRAREMEKSMSTLTGGPAASMDDMLAMPAAEESGEVPADAPAEAAVVLALKELRYAELKIVGFRGSDRGKLRPLTAEDRAGLDAALAGRVAQTIDLALQTAAAAERRSLGIPVEQSAGSFDYRYDSDGVVDVPSDGQVHNVALLKRRADIKNVYVVVPRESTDVVRIATMKNPLAVPLLAGDAEVYLDDEFLVGTAVRTVPSGGELTIGLGVEPAVKVARRVRFDEESEGFLRGSRGLDHAIEIEVASRLKTRIDVDVRERVPVLDPGEKEITIETKDVAPAWEDFAQPDTLIIRGGHRWLFSLDAGDKKTLSFAYRVKIDGKAELAGGNRREPY